MRSRVTWSLGMALAVLVAAAVQLGSAAPQSAAWPVEKHRGVDSCANESVSRMQNLYTHSPYGTYGFYVGGLTVNRVCPNHASFHTKAWADAVKRQGWNLQPIYSGRQPSCLGSPSYPISSNTTTAFNQGVADGRDAITQAYARGISGPLWLDIEGYVANGLSCQPATDAYTKGWMQTVAANRAYITSLYASYPNVIRAASWPVAQRPYQVTVPHWNNVPGVYSGLPNLPRSYWVNHQRGHQYRGGHNEVWNGQTYLVDNNCYDQIVHGNTVHSTYNPCLQ